MASSVAVTYHIASTSMQRSASVDSSTSEEDESDKAEEKADEPPSALRYKRVNEHWSSRTSGSAENWADADRHFRDA
jgi:hypothetical protein